MKLQLIRSATLKINYLNECFLIDPYFAEKFSRPSFTGKSKNPLVDLPLSIDDILSKVEMIIISHLHSDHFDSVAQSTIDKNILIICQPEDEVQIKDMPFKNVHAIDSTYRWKNISIKRTYAKHGSGYVLSEMGITSGFLFKADGEPSIYWTGDTILCDKVKEILIKERPEIIITHSCGAEWGNGVKIVMDKVETIEICKLLPNSIIIATHMDSLDHATVSRVDLRQYARENNIKDNQLIILNDGEQFNYVL